MTPYPESATASHLLKAMSHDNNPDIGILYASSKGEINYSANTITVNIQPNYGNGISIIPCNGLLSIPMSVYGGHDFHMTRLFDLAPATRDVVTRFGGDKRISTVYGVSMDFERRLLNMRVSGTKAKLRISTHQKGNPDYFERYIASAVMVAPAQCWETIEKSGLLVLQDPVGYSGQPLIDLIGMPDSSSGHNLRKVEASDYVTGSMWEKFGNPFIIHIRT